MSLSRKLSKPIVAVIRRLLTDGKRIVKAPLPPIDMTSLQTWTPVNKPAGYNAATVQSLGITNHPDIPNAGLSEPFEVRILTPGAPNLLCLLSNDNREVALCGPGSFFVSRPQLAGTPFGVYKEV